MGDTLRDDIALLGVLLLLETNLRVYLVKIKANLSFPAFSSLSQLLPVLQLTFVFSFSICNW